MADKENPPIKEGGVLQSPGRKANAAQPLSAARDNAGAARYPDNRRAPWSGEARSFEPKVRNETAPEQPAANDVGAAFEEGRGKPRRKGVEDKA